MAEERWQVTVRVPMGLPQEKRERLFNRIATAVIDWEPLERDGWDTDLSAGPADDTEAFGRDAAKASLEYSTDWVSDLLDDYGLGRPDGLAGGLDQIGEAFRLASWLLAESEGKRERERSSRQAWAEEALRLDDQVRAKSRLSLVDKGDPSQVCYGSDGECTSRTFHLGSCPKSPSYMLPAIPANAPCACPTEEQLAKLGSGFTRPQCTVHPESGGAQ